MLRTHTNQIVKIRNGEGDMRRTKLNFGRFHGARFSRQFSQWAGAAVLLTACFAVYSAAQQQGQKTFASAADASAALMAAAKDNDQTALLAILGPAGKDIISSGDPTQDRERRANIAQKYAQMHRLMKEPDGTTTLYLGAENWPLPIPLVHKGQVWYFDTEDGKKEILYRRVGENELSTIRSCQGLVAAQKEYYASQNHVYAGQIFSDEGKQNGLYWKAAEGDAESPIGPLVAAAVAEGYDKGRNGPPTPYHGYLYHVLTSQGASAPGGAKSYIVDGKMTGGFAFVAYPAMYRSSGVMTFIVGPNGIVYRKDLGKETETIGKAMKTFNPDPTWHKDEDQQEMKATAQATK
jgi:Protein of unknown function (DUF2950)